jgi:hypothetical protein
MTVDLSLSYSGSIGPMDATFVVLLERARVGEGVEFNIVGHE